MKDYFCEINKNYSILKQIKLSIVISFVLLILDILELPSSIIYRYGLPVFLLISIGVLMLIGLTLVENGFFDTFKIKSVNYIDTMVHVSFFSILIYISLIFLLGELYLYKLITIGGYLMLISSVGYIRYRNYVISKKQSKIYESNIIDLKDLYEGNLEKLEGQTILLDESSVDYDLLNRDKVINHLYDSIVSTNPDGKFVISLEGRWGSGKTTIIRNTKKMILKNNENIVVIDEFDPWIYGDENALLLNMFNMIIRKSGFKHSNLSAAKLTEDLSELVLGTNSSSILKSLFSGNSAVNMKLKINNYLKMSGKKFVFFLDNIDRTEKENVILLFKLVGNILDFERITYVLSFDDKRVKEIFSDGLSIDYEYLKKIINLQIRVPEIDKAVLHNIYDISLKNILTLYGESKESLKDYDVIIDFISDKGLDVRDFKRFINSAVNSSFKTKHSLYRKDLLIIDYIKLFNFPLYNIIFSNKKYFISHDQRVDHQIYKYSFDNKKFNPEGKEFFRKLFEQEEHLVYKNILADIFPYIDKYNRGEELVYTGAVIIEDPEYRKISKQRKICSAKYFDLYFTETSNVFTEIGIIVENLIKQTNKNEPFINKEATLKKVLRTVHYSHHKEIFERLQLYEDDLKQENIFDFIKVVFNNIELVDDSHGFVGLNAKARVAIIFHILLNKLSNNEYESFLEYTEREYGKLRFLQDILYWFINDKEDINVNGRKELLEQTIKDIAADVYNNNLNLYDDIYYVPQNIWGLYHENIEEQNKLKSYIKLILNEKNVIRFLNDLIGVSIGTKYGYYIRKEALETFTNEDSIDIILKDYIPKNDDEEFVLQVYEAYRDEIKNTWGEPALELNKQKKLVL